MAENATLDYAAGIDQSLEAILKSTKKMKECLEVSGATAFPADVIASITDSCRSLIRLKAGSETLKSAVAETTDQVSVVPQGYENRSFRRIECQAATRSQIGGCSVPWDSLSYIRRLIFG